MTTSFTTFFFTHLAAVSRKWRRRRLPPTMGNALGTANWPKVFFTRTVPPVSGDYDIARRFKRVAAKYNLATGCPMSIQSHIAPDEASV